MVVLENVLDLDNIYCYEQVGDENGQFSAQMNLADLRNVLCMKLSPGSTTAGVIQ